MATPTGGMSVEGKKGLDKILLKRQPGQGFTWEDRKCVR